MSVPWIFPDELIYTEMAKSLADGESPSVRGVRTLDYGVVYPGVVAAAWLFPDLETAYTVARWINAFVMSLAAVPAFFLARRYTSDAKAVLVAAFALLVPSMAYAGTLMTEVAFYPVFLCALLAVAAALDKPSPKHQLLAVGAIGVAYATKPSALALVPAYLAALGLLALTEPGDWRHRLSAYRLTYCIVGLSAAGAVVLGLVTKGDPAGALGAYAVVVHEADLDASIRWFLGNLSGLALYLGVIPLTATTIVAVRALRHRRPDPRRSFAALALTTTIFMVATVAVTGSAVSQAAGDGASRLTPLSDRNLFVVAPLLLLGLALWTDDRRRSIRALCIAVASTIALVAVYPWDSAPNAANPQNVATLPYIALLPDDGYRVLATIAVAVALGALLLFVPWNRMGRLWIGLGFAYVVTALVSVAAFAIASDSTERRWATHGDRAWIDELAGPSGEVVVVWPRQRNSGTADGNDPLRMVWLSEAYNRSVRSVYVLAPSDDHLPVERLSRRGTDLTVVGGRPLTAGYVLTRCPMTIEGELLREVRSSGARLYAVPGSVRVAREQQPC